MKFQLALAMAALTLLSASGGRAGGVRTVALNGQQAPGADAPFSVNFGTPVLNNRGQTAFQNNTAGGGLWSEQGGRLGIVALQGDAAPGVPGAFFSVLDSGLGFNDAGRVAFSSSLFGDGITAFTNNNHGLWVGDHQGATLVAREGDAAPGSQTGSEFDTLSGLVLNRESATAFRTFQRGNGQLGAIAQGFPGDAAVTVEFDMPAPGAPLGSRFSLVHRPVLTDAGSLAFRGFLSGPDVGVSNGDDTATGIWSTRSGEIELVVRGGDPAGGLPGLLFNTPGDPAVNSRGQIAFFAGLRGPAVGFDDNSVWRESNGVFDLVAREGAPAPGAGDGNFFSSFSNPLLSSSGSVAFYGSVGERSSQGRVFTGGDTGLWVGDGQTLTGVALEGAPAPDAGPGAVFDRFSLQANNRAGIGATSINAHGRVAFTAFLDGENVTTSNAFGLWAQDGSGALRLIARHGDEIELDNGETRTISGLRFAGGAGDDDGRSSGFNDLGQVAFYADFVGGGSGVFVSNAVAALPDPPGDYNADGVVSAADYAVWRDTAGSVANLPGDATPGVIDGADYGVWQAGFGPAAANAANAATIPEPSAGVLAITAAFAIGRRRAARLQPVRDER